MKIREFLTMRWLFPMGGLVLGIAAVFILWDLVKPHTFGGTLMQSPQPAVPFQAGGPGGSVVRLEDFRGKVVLLFFGYTACPDICPTTLQTLGETLDLLGRRAGQVQALMFSVDPEKDNPQRLQAYLNHIDGRILGVSTDLETTTSVAMQYGVFFEKQYFSDTGYLVDHTATVLLIDPQGYLRVVYPYNTDAAVIASDVRYILTH